MTSPLAQAVSMLVPAESRRVAAQQAAARWTDTAYRRVENECSDRLRREVDAAQRAVSEALTKLSRTLSSADWKDRARQDFHSRLQAAQGSARTATSKLDELIAFLDRKLRDLEIYLR